MPEISTRPAAWVAHTYSNTQVSTEHGVVGGFMRESGPGLVHGYTRAAGLAGGQVAGGSMTTSTEQRQEIDRLMAEFRSTPVTDPNSYALLERAEALARTVHGDPVVGRPEWAVNSEDNTAATDPDEHVVCHYGEPVSISNRPAGSDSGVPAKPIIVTLEQNVTEYADGRVEVDNVGVYIANGEDVHPSALRPLAAALLNAADVLDAAK